MGSTNRFGKNIKALRLLYKESRRDLAEALHYSYKTIEAYENDRRLPDGAALEQFAKHFMVSPEQLINIDFSNVVTFEKEPYIIYKKMFKVFPVFKAEIGSVLELTVESHKAAWLDIIKTEGDAIENIMEDDQLDRIKNQYLDAFENESLAVEERSVAAGNLLGIIYFSIMVDFQFELLKTRPAPIIVLTPKEQIEIDELLDSIYVHNEIKSYKSEEYIDALFHLKDFIRKDKKISDVAYYYSCWDFILGIEQGYVSGGKRLLQRSQEIGYEMLGIFTRMGNRYAEMFLETISESIITKDE